MYRKLTLLISVVYLFGLAVGVSAEDLEVPWGECLIIDDVCEVSSIQIEGCVIVECTGVLIVTGDDDRSSIDGCGGDGPGGSESARLIINGGQVYVHSRFDMGKGCDARLIVNDDGYFWQGCCGDDWNDGVKFPDDDGGEHYITINNGTVDVHCFETITERHAKFELGCPSLLCQRDASAGNTREDPIIWAASGDLYCDPPCTGPFVEWEDSKVCAYCFLRPCHAWGESPEDGSTEICPDVCLTWEMGGCGMGGHPGDKHYLFFGTSYEEVNEADIGDPHPLYVGFFPPGLEDYCPPGLELWTTYCWRVDEKPFGQPTVRGPLWTFTTGCEIMPGDINLDCIVDSRDWAMLADDWMEMAFFPDDF